LDVAIKLLNEKDEKRLGDYAPDAKAILFVNVASE